MLKMEVENKIAADEKDLDSYNQKQSDRYLKDISRFGNIIRTCDTCREIYNNSNVSGSKVLTILLLSLVLNGEHWILNDISFGINSIIDLVEGDYKRNIDIATDKIAELTKAGD